MPGLFAALLAVTAAYSIGHFADRIIFQLGGERPNLENSVYRAVLGAGILSFIIFFLAIAGLVYSGLFWGLLIVFGILSIYLFAASKQNERKIEKLNVLETILVCIIALTAILLLILSFRPVTNLDALSQIALLPKSYIAKHALYNLTAYSPSYSYTQLITMLDMLVMSLSNEVALNHLHLLLGFLTCAIMYTAVRKAANRTTALLTVIIIMTSGVFFDMAVIAKIDIGIALFSAAAFYCLINWRLQKNNGWFVMSAVFCAFSFGVKYNGGLVPLLPGVFYFYSVWTDKKPAKEYIMLALLSTVVFTACVSPWLILNFAFTRDPVSPFLATFFNDTSMTPAMRVLNKNYFNEASSGYFTYLKDAFLGMPILFFAFFAGFKKNLEARLAFIFGALYLLTGAVFFLHADRIFFPSFILFDFAAACAVWRIFNIENKAVRRALTFIFFAMTAYSVYAIGNEVARKENLPYFTGSLSKTAFLAKNVSCYKIAETGNKLIPKNEKILGLGDPRGYYFGQEYVQEFSRVGFDIINKSGPKEVVLEMKKNGINYILFSDETYFKERQSPIFNSPVFLKDNFELVAKEGDYSLLKLK